MTTTKTAPQIITEVLGMSLGKWLAVHEITGIARSRGHYISDNAAATRLAVDFKGQVDSQYREGKKFKEWRLKS